MNPADQDMDEEAERRAFQKAVMEWRNMGKADSQAAPSASAGMWSNPISDPGDAGEERRMASPREAAPTAAAGGGKVSGSLADGELDEAKEREVKLYNSVVLFYLEQTRECSNS